MLSPSRASYFRRALAEEPDDGPSAEKELTYDLTCGARASMPTTSPTALKIARMAARPQHHDQRRPIRPLTSMRHVADPGHRTFA